MQIVQYYVTTYFKTLIVRGSMQEQYPFSIIASSSSTLWGGDSFISPASFGGNVGAWYSSEFEDGCVVTRSDTASPCYADEKSSEYVYT